MRYNYEALNEQTFQQLAQALILVEHPRAQCLPVAQPDGGRDAFVFQGASDKKEFIVFQVKYSRDPQNKDERATINDLVVSERDKIPDLVRRGATHYYFITNVPGTAHLDSGSIDRAVAALADGLGIPSQVWWRDDLDRRLDKSTDVKWAYPQVLNASDVLPLLVKHVDIGDPKSTRTIKSYIATQYQTDREIKFKQVELARTLTDLFVDLPLTEKGRQDHLGSGRRSPRTDLPAILDNHLSQLELYDDDGPESLPFRHGGLAAAFLLQLPLTNGVTRFVLEGAPGQGKSTVTQFLCQINRLRILSKNGELSSVDAKHIEGPARVPFRVDLRDYAVWLNGGHPFSKDDYVPPPDAASRSLEAFIAMQVTWFAGSVAVNQDQLLQFLERCHSVIVLDGFDEVADIPTRARLVDEICNAAARLDAHSRSLQLIVTSRPAAFANSPGFPEADWVHLELRNLRRVNILAYTEKWIHAQGLTPQEADMVSSTLEDKLEQPHLRDLARNPMQLAILLHLIHVQGAALPEKRTTLYEEYMKLFFNREAEKSTIVRDRRELLLSIHGVLAWLLQGQAEVGSGSGSITKEALGTHIRSFLETEEHNPALADTLLTGTVERVGALVSRIEGTFEFEVQPLREYFAARHLYKTSPYSPPGSDRRGTRPDRLDALARSSYWTNVTRFFCGFYDVGELGTLVDGLIQIGDDNTYRLINQPRQLAMMLLADHVFSQSPRTVKRLIAYVTQEPAFRRLTAHTFPRRAYSMGLPEMAGRETLFDICLKKLEDETDPARRGVLRQIAASNATGEKLKNLWVQRFRQGTMRDDPLHEASDYGIVGRFSVDEIDSISGANIDLRLRWFTWTNNYDAIRADPDLWEKAGRAILDGTMIFPLRAPWLRGKIGALEVLTQSLNVHLLSEVFTTDTGEDSLQAFMERLYGFASPDRSWNVDHDGTEGDRVTEFAQYLTEHFQTESKSWRTTLEPWSKMVDYGFEFAPGSPILTRIAILSTAVASTSERGRWTDERFSTTRGLVDRLYSARSRQQDQNWWRDQLRVVKRRDLAVCIAVFAAWVDPEVLLGLKEEVSECLDILTPEEFGLVLTSCDNINQAAGQHQKPVAPGVLENITGIGPRLALVMIRRIEEREKRREFGAVAFRHYAGGDSTVLSAVATDQLLPEGTENPDWKFVCHLSMLARKAEIEVLWPVGRSETVTVPDEVAEMVLDNCEEHCGQLVALCERSRGVGVAAEAEKVSVVAERDSWFAVHPL